MDTCHGKYKLPKLTPQEPGNQNDKASHKKMPGGFTLELDPIFKR